MKSLFRCAGVLVSSLYQQIAPEIVIGVLLVSQLAVDLGCYALRVDVFVGLNAVADGFILLSLHQSVS